MQILKCDYCGHTSDDSGYSYNWRVVERAGEAHSYSMAEPTAPVHVCMVCWRTMITSVVEAHASQ